MAETHYEVIHFRSRGGGCSSKTIWNRHLTPSTVIARSWSKFQIRDVTADASGPENGRKKEVGRIFSPPPSESCRETSNYWEKWTLVDITPRRNRQANFIELIAIASDRWRWDRSWRIWWWWRLSSGHLFRVEWTPAINKAIYKKKKKKKKKKKSATLGGRESRWNASIDKWEAASSGNDESIAASSSAPFN